MEVIKLEENILYTVLSVGNNLCSSKKIQRSLLKFNIGIVNTPLLITTIQFEELLINLNPDLVILNLDTDEAIDFAKFANAFKIPHVYLTSSSSKIKIKPAMKTHPRIFFRVPISDDEVIYNIRCILGFTFFKGVKKDLDTEGISEKTAPRPASGYRLIQCTMSKSVLIKIDQLLFFKSDGVHVNVTCKQSQFQTRSTMKELIELIGSDNVVQTHKSYGVNLIHAREVRINSIQLDGIEIPISKRYYSDLMFKLNNLL